MIIIAITITIVTSFVEKQALEDLVPACTLRFHYNFAYVKRLALGLLSMTERSSSGTCRTGPGCAEFYDENKFNREDLFRHVTEQEGFRDSGFRV